jgi:hypothetical protein
MRFDNDTRTRLIADLTLSIDPATSTVEIQVDSTWYPATWQGTAVAASGKWTQTAQTTGYFAGPNAAASGAVVLTAGRHPTQTRITKGGDILVHPSTPIDVV